MGISDIFYDFLKPKEELEPEAVRIGLDGVERTLEEYDEWRKTPEAEKLYSGSANIKSRLNPEGSLPSGTFEIPWGSNEELSDILNDAGILWNVPSEVFKLLGEAEYVQGYDDMFLKRPSTKAAVRPSIPRMLLPGENTQQYKSDSGLNYSNILHELPHLTSKYFRFLNEDGSVRPEWQSVDSKGLTGYKFSNTEISPYLADYEKYKDLSFYDRANKFSEAWLNDPMNQQRPELKNAIGNAMGFILADDMLFDDSVLHNKNKAYATSPEEIYARAMNTYGIMKNMSLEDRNIALNPVPSFEEWRKINPYLDANVYINKAKTYRNMVNNNFSKPTGKFDNDNNPYMKKEIYFIRPETYFAIDSWMQENKPNKTGDGFAQLEIDNMLDSNMYA